MDNQIVLDLKLSERNYSIYVDNYSTLSTNEFKFQTDFSIRENLHKLSSFALKDPVPVLYSYPLIFLDLVGRWFENDNQISVLSALSRLVNISPESMSLVEYYLETKCSIWDNLPNDNDLQIVLLAFYRFIKYDGKLKKYIDPKVLNSIISDNSNVSKYLALIILGIYMEMSEESISNFVDNLNLSDIKGNYEGYEIDYKFLDLVESKRISNFQSLLHQRIEETNGPKLIIKPEHLCPLVTSVYGVLVPNLIDSRTDHDDTLVATNNAVGVLRQLALNMQKTQPTLLYGNAGSGKTFLFNQLAKMMGYQDSIVKIHLGEQTDAKLLLGTYSSGEKPGTFKWRSGVLTTAVKEGKWVLIEDIDKAPTEVLSILLTLLEKRQLIIPSRGEVIKAHNNFQLISTIRLNNDSSTIPDLIGMRLWSLIHVPVLSEMELLKILTAKFPLLKNLVKMFIRCFNEICKVYSTSSFISLNKGSHPRIISSRDLFKFCYRCDRLLVNNGITSSNQLIELSVYDNFFQEAVDCFGSAITEHNALIPLTNVIGECLEVAPSRINLFLSKHVPMFMNDEDKLKVGRAVLKKSDRDLVGSKKSGSSSFATTNHSLRLMEQICVSIEMIEPVLLVGETGTGKTTVVQQVAKLMNKKLTVINVSQQTESGDLLGGYKPVNTKIIALPLQEVFENLFLTTFSRKKNEKFSTILSKVFNRNQWKNVIKLWREAIKMSKGLLNVEIKESESESETNDKKKRKLKSHDRKILLDKWIEFEAKVSEFEIQSSSLDNSFVFNFVEGSLVHAIRNGDWLLLDEINLASSDTLESIADLLAETVDQRSILLSEKGDIEPIRAHPEFRIFGCMNPSTDVGKRDLPTSIRSRFTEIYVHSPDRDFSDLLAIIDKYIGRFSLSDELVSHDVANLYLEAKVLAESNKIVDGANQKPHFSIRTLTRTLIYVADIVGIYGLRRSLYEGFCMSFLTLLDIKSEKLLHPLIQQYTIDKLKNAKSVMKQSPPCPSKNPDDYVQFKHYWMKHGPEPVIEQPNYIITPFVEKNMLNLVRATAIRRFPVLIQGPTSAGKTSMIQYLANITGHKFVRINNHEHTDLQEYLGTYVSDSTGKLTFKEGVLVEAIRNGYWIVLDELNLAPTDILEALNRLLDDNRELFIPETQEVVRPHPDFMLFATQNPPGLYGGRKMLSRAFRNRFLELHFDDIPQDELEIILRERCQIAPSYCKKIVEVYKQLTIQRQSTRLFEQKNSFATLRDLFRWALREAVGYEELAANGYMLLAERVRKEDERIIVKKTIEKVMRVKLDMDLYYEKLEEKALMNVESSIVWTKAMRRLAVLVSTSIKYKEPLLLVGETGCGKTTVCQVISQFLGQEMVTVNAHQNTETSDILGAQRPVRNRFETRSRLFNNLVSVLDQLEIEIPLEDAKLEELVAKFEAISDFQNVQQDILDEIRKDIINSKILFEWNDGPLIRAMKNGDMFLLDEISLADDSVLERLNSVLEPERSLLLAEKGVDDSFIVANEKFQFLATMNPGGDYGKKELSPALRNRFTEIWVPSMDNFDDVKQIVSSKLDSRVSHLTDAIVEFSKYFGTTYGGGDSSSGVISLRDILAWVQFINNCSEDVKPFVALLHGASMVFIDALGTNNTAYLAENEDNLTSKKHECVHKISLLVSEDLLPIYTSDFEICLSNDALTAGSFQVPRVSSNPVDDFLLHAPTTAANAMRVVRAMQVHKPILLEGSPGVGKTSLVSAIAKATGNNLVRINLSEQTDLIDLFGSDTPAEGGKTGEFVWRDAPFLRAMQRGEWVLLDEMNLASQSVLEGLNACLDHRGEAYIPELDKSFACHKDFTVFAAQNPQYQGGGRKGLPKSFVNRFTVVYVDILKLQDLNMISTHLYPSVDTEVTGKMIEFMSKLEEEVVTRKLWGSSGGPWEFNLRDTLRWLQLFSEKAIVNDITPSDFVDMIIVQRFRSHEDKTKAVALFESVFGPVKPRDNYYKKSTRFIQAGTSILERAAGIHKQNGTKSVGLQCNYNLIESAIDCIKHNLPLILVGPSNAGKTELARYIAQTFGANLKEFAMNSDVDSMDILGGYEQVDMTRNVTDFITKLNDTLQRSIVNYLKVSSESALMLQHALEFYRFIQNPIDSSNFESAVEYLKSFASLTGDSVYFALLVEANKLLVKVQEKSSVKFEWFDGLLVQAVENGDWLILDNANLCSPSVLDRLNSLLEVNGSLMINECSTEDGQPRVLKPHPNFRLFLTVDPKYGELSRAMRNRGIELYFDNLHQRALPYDKLLLGYPEAVNEDQIVKFENLSVTEKSYSPLARYGFTFSSDEIFGQIHDIFHLHGKSESLASLATGLFEFRMFDLIDKWGKLIKSCPEFNETEVFFAQEIESRLTFLKDFGTLKYLFDIYGPELEFVSPFQAINPAINSIVSSVLTQTRTALGSSEPASIFQVIGDMLNFQVNLNQIEQKAMNGNMADLSYVERSAAHSMGRSIKKVPRLNVYQFLASINKFFIELFKSTSETSIFVHPNIYKALYELGIIRQSLLSVSHSQNESQIRVYRDLIKTWCKENQHLDTSLLEISIDSFSDSLDLKTGFLMERLWENFRRQYPDSSENWYKLEKLLEIFGEFDIVAAKQDLDTIEQISAFKKSLLEVYDSITEGTITTEEFDIIVENLSNGIAKLSEITKTFSVKRVNHFQYEFNLLLMFIQANDSNSTNLMKISSLANRPIVQFTTKDYAPYPAIFDNISRLENGKYNSVAPDLFNGSLLTSSLHKSVRFGDTPGKLLNIKLRDLKVIGRELVNNSESVLKDIKISFRDMLETWINKIASVVTVDSEEIQSVIDNYFTPALELAKRSDNKQQLGVAYVLFACGAIQGYLPSSAYDPAVKEHVIYDKVLYHKKETEQLVNAWATASEVLSGEKLQILEELEKDQSTENPPKPKVFRTSSFDPVFEEWKAFMDSSVNPEQIHKLIESAQELSEESEQLIAMFQNNSSQFVFRLDSNHKYFSDLNTILKGYIFALKFGYDLIAVSAAEMGRYSTSLSNLTDVTNLGNFEKLQEMFQEFVKFSKKQRPDSQVTEEIMSYFLSVSFAHGIEVAQPVIDTALQALYYRWTLRKLKEAEENMENENWYKYKDPDADIEEDFKTLFPDYEEVIEVDIKTIKTTQSYDLVYHKIAKSYIAAFSDDSSIELSDMIKDGSKIISSLNDKADKFEACSNNASSLVSVLLNFAQTFNEFSQDSDVNFDFYRESSYKQTRKAIDIIHGIISFTKKLLDEWPDHATLKEIHRVCNEFLDFSLNIPIARQLQKIEQIYTFISEWEKYAHSKVSLKMYFDQLTSLIVSWRRLELSTWKQLFHHEDKALEINIGKWWFHLFEVIILPLYSGEEINLTTLLAALNVFISQTTLGEFKFRLKLIDAFRLHVKKIEFGSQETFNAMTNFMQFYSQFTSIIDAKLEAEKKVLEKDINEIILLASWKDVNIDALKQSARKSHNSLYKVVRKYRSLLMISVSTFIEQGLNDDIKISLSNQRSITVKGVAIDPKAVNSLVSSVSTWKERPSRLQDLTMVDKNMTVYVERISNEKLPDLYDFAKEILEESDKLKNETPSVYKEETKKQIAALKNEKAKLFSNTLKELRRIGISNTSKPEVKKAQASSNLMLSISTSFGGTILEGCDNYYFRIIEMLPRLKSAMLQMPDDISQPDLERGFAVAENIVYNLIVSRQPLAQLAFSVSKVEQILESFAGLSQLYDSKDIIVPTTTVQSIKENISLIKGMIDWLPRICNFAIQSIESISVFGERPASDVFYYVKSKVPDFAKRIEQLNQVGTSESTRLIEDFNLFIDTVIDKVNEWMQNNTSCAFVGLIVLLWLSSSSKIFVNSSTTISDLKVVEDVEKALRELSNSVIVVIQKTTEIQKTTVTEEDDDWFKTVQSKYMSYIKSTYHKKIIGKLENVVKTIEQIEHNEMSSKLVSAMVAFTMPIVQHYLKLIVSVVDNSRTNYIQTSHAAFILVNILQTLATKGFCSPEAPSEEKQDDDLKDGTGLGDGEGATNNSNDVEEDEDLDEQAQTDNKEKDDDQKDEENGDAVEMEGDMAGDLEDASDQDKSDEEDNDEEGEDMDEEVDDIDDLDPNEVDEKMWDEEAKNDKEKESDKVPESKGQDDMVANENEEPEANENEGEGNEDDQKNDDEKEEEGDDGEEKDVGEQEDDVKNQEGEQMDDHVPESEALDLPDDMNLDGDDEEEGKDEEEDEEHKDNIDDMDVEDEKKEDEDDEENKTEETNDAQAEEDENAEEQEEDGDEEVEDQGEPTGVDEEPEPEGQGEASDGEELGDKDEEKEKDQNKEEGGEDEAAEGVDGANNDENEDEVDVESAVKQESGERGEGADNQVVDEQDDMGASGAASNQQDQDQEKSEAPQQDEANDMARESIKELGDALKEFHRRHQEIKEASKTEEQVEEKAGERPDEFEHVEGDNADTDTQAMGAADKDQIQKIDEDKAIDDDEEEADVEMKQEEHTDVKQEADDMDIDDLEEMENDGEADADFKGKTKGGFINDRSQVKEEAGLMSHELDEETQLDLMDIDDRDVMITDQDEPPIDMTVARDLWRNSELATQELASGLCEQLRLILEPTLATKLRGDYKTGKRLNMKRIIPYIASEFRKDKIWLRRTKPSKRQYQVMIAVDDSKSMSESKSTELAFHSIALVSKALTQLEAGGLSIVRFGEDVKVVHPFDKPFNNQESGAKIFQYFDFQQTRTDIKNLCSKSLKIFENAKITSNSDLWQLQIIISDGVCEDHETVQALVRKAREAKIMLVFVIIDGINSNESILDMSQVRYEFDANGNSVLKVDKYLDSFPFEFYVVVRDINELPEMLSLILRQYFSEVAQLA